MAAERLTCDLKVHGTDGMYQPYGTRLRIKLITYNAGPLVLGFPNMRPGYDIILQDTLKQLGFPSLIEPVSVQNDLSSKGSQRK